VADIRLVPLTALGEDAAVVRRIGAVTITENPGLALASLATRKGGAAKLAGVAERMGIGLPGPGGLSFGAIYDALWLGPEQWLVIADFATNELIAADLEAAFGDAASVTEQTDAWVVFDLAGPDPAPVMERLCPYDIRAAPPGSGTRTLIEHMGCYVMVREGTIRILGARSSAGSLLHALEGAVRSVA
jgi:sarcosine oxidase, subunit gamma